MTEPLRRAVLERRRARADGGGLEGVASLATAEPDAGAEPAAPSFVDADGSATDDAQRSAGRADRVSRAARLRGRHGDSFEALDDDQRAAVAAIGDVVLEAAVGSGKTTVLIERVRALRAAGVPLGRIAVLTFTRKAATEVLWRLGGAPGEAGAPPRLTSGDDTWLIGTFHSVARSLLSRALPVEALGFSRRFGVLDAHRRAALWRELIARHGLDIRYVDALEVRLTGVAEGRLRHGRMRRDDDLLRLVELYEEEKRALNAMDFEDLIHGATALLSALPAERRPLHIIVDELQDCDRDQLDLLAALRGGEGPSGVASGGGMAGPAPLFAVGDPHQAIYGWRCADTDAFAACRDRFGCRTLRLRANRRSQAVLVAAAESLRRGALPSEPGLASWAPLQAVRPAGAPIAIVHYGNAAAEAAWVAEALAAALTEGVAPARLAVLARLRRQLQPVAQACLRRNLPLRRPPSPDNEAAALSWLQALLRAGLDGDLGALRLCLGDAERGLCPAAALRDVEAAAAADGGALAAVEARLQAYGRRSKRFDAALARRTFAGLRALGPLLDEGVAPEGGDALAAQIAAKLPIQGLLRPTRAGFADEAALLEVALRGICADAIARSARDLRAAMRDAVEDAGLAGHARPGEDTGTSLVEELAIDREGIALRTIHAAKGLEFERVWLIGCNDGVLPLAGAWSRPASLREEQRLLFVGVTRARDRLEISWSAAPGVPRASPEPSALLRMLPPECVEWRSEALQATNLTAPPSPVEAGHAPPMAVEASLVVSAAAAAAELASDESDSGKFSDAGRRGGMYPSATTPARATPAEPLGRVAAGSGADTSSVAPVSTGRDVSAPTSAAASAIILAAPLAPLAGDGDSAAPLAAAVKSDPFGVGAKVRHVRHGEGTVTLIDDLAIEVEFTRFGRKRLLRALAGLTVDRAPVSTANLNRGGGGGVR